MEISFSSLSVEDLVSSYFRVKQFIGFYENPFIKKKSSINCFQL
jgi:hypothetical protein